SGQDETTQDQAASGQPTIVKDSIQVTAFTFNDYKKSFDTWSWVPMVAFRVNGPIASGSQLYAEFTQPGSGPWVKFDCKTEEVQKGKSLKTEGGGHDISEDKGSLYTGPVNFAIKMRNELAGGADATLFSGRIKVLKAHSNEGGTKVANHYLYYVDQDWNLPIGYAFFSGEKSSPQFNVAFWVRGDADTASFEPHLFYQGKEVGRMFFEGNQVEKAGAKPELEDVTTRTVESSMPQKAKWARVVCNFPSVRRWDKTGVAPGPWGPQYLLNANPGDYECKVLWHNHLSRSLKFTVDSNGKFDNGIATNNNCHSHRIIVPVQIIGDQDGQWDHNAWKTDAFYGNPLTGFVAVP
ncbi:MAG: hypothetical protein ACRD3W_06670, partial [Terriglobales bacterium]